MALFVYRYRLKLPVLEEQLEAEVGASVTISDYAGGGVVDIQCDDSLAQDLSDVMATRGYEFVEGSPATTAAQGFRSSNSIVGNDEHKVIRQLIHFVGTNSPGESFAAGPYASEVNYTGNNPINETWFTSAAKTARICRWEATYSGVIRDSETWIVYKDDGTNPAAMAVDAISYSGLKETGRVRTITVY